MSFCKNNKASKVRGVARRTDLGEREDRFHWRHQTKEASSPFPPHDDQLCWEASVEETDGQGGGRNNEAKMGILLVINREERWDWNLS